MLIFENSAASPSILMIASDGTFLEKLNLLIDENLDDPAFSIGAICQAFSISRSQLYRIAKEQTDRSVSLYIRKRRIWLYAAGAIILLFLTVMSVYHRSRGMSGISPAGASPSPATIN